MKNPSAHLPTSELEENSSYEDQESHGEELNSSQEVLSFLSM